MFEEGPLGCLGLAHESGWMTGQNFHASLVHFHTFVKSCKTRPVLLIMDNHSSHLDFQAVNFAKNNGIVLLTLPPHCSHVLQPLDVTVFGPFKKAIGECQNDWLFQNPGGRISIKEIAALSRRPYHHTFTPDKIIKGFVTTGICPFSRFAIPDARYAPSMVTNRPGNMTYTIYFVLMISNVLSGLIFQLQPMTLYSVQQLPYHQ